MYYGWNGTIGLIVPVLGPAPEYEFNRHVPDGFAVLTQRIPLIEVTYTGLSAMEDDLMRAAKLLTTAKPDLLAFGCTSGSLIRGSGYDKTLIARMEAETGIPSITTTTAVLQALHILRGKRVAVVTPYCDAVNKVEQQVLSEAGFPVCFLEGLGYTDPHNMPKTTYETLYPLCNRACASSCDVLFISCTGLGIMDCIPQLEAEFHKPVVTSNQATLWYALRRLGYTGSLSLGQLFVL